MSNLDAESLANDLALVRSKMESLENRLALVEDKLKSTQLENKLINTPQQVVQPAHPARPTQPTPTPATAPPPQPGPAAAGPSKQQEQGGAGLENKIGTVWLNRLGAGVFLIGVVSLLMYSFQFFGPAVRVAVGVLFAAAIILWSHTRKNAKPDQQIFFEGLNALGWSLAYFVVYGMHFLEPMKVNPSLLLEMVLLACTAAGAMADAVAFKSESVALFSNTFAFGAIFLCLGSVEPSICSLAFVVIAIAVTYVSILQKWYVALFVCCCCFFTSLFLADSHASLQTANGLATYRQRLTLECALLVGWLTFISASWSLKEIPKAKRWAVLGTSLLSGFCFTGMTTPILIDMLPTVAKEVIQAFVYGITGSIYLFTARLFKKRGLDDLWSLHLLIGLSLVNACRWVKLGGGDSGLAADVSEIALLVGMGMHFNVPVFRYFAAFWALVAVCHFTDSSAILLFGVVSAAVCVHLYWREDLKKLQKPYEAAFFGPWFFIIANLFCLHLICTPPFTNWHLAMLMAQAAINVFVTLKLRWKTTAVVTATLYAFGLCLIFPPQVYEWPIASALCYTAYFYCRNLLDKQTNDNYPSDWKIAVAIFGNLILIMAIGAHAASTYVSAEWGLLGVILVGLGFYLREKTFRILAMSIFAIVLIRLLFIDLATASTVQRIISFIVAGAAIFGCSYVYMWFGKRLNPAAETYKADEQPM